MAAVSALVLPGDFSTEVWMPRSEAFAHDGQEVPGQRDHVDHVGPCAVQHLAVVGDGDLGFECGRRRQALLVEVRHADEPHLGFVGNHLEVAAAVISGADHRRLEGRHCASSSCLKVVSNSH